MLCSALAVIIIINLVFTQDTTAKGVFSKESRRYTSHLAPTPFLEKENYSLVRENRKAVKRFKIRDLESVKVQLENVVEKYELKTKKLSALYGGVSSCGLNSCEKFHGFPEDEKFKNFHCKKIMKPYRLKNQTLKLLADFHKGLESYVQIFQEVINFEKWPPFKEDGISNDSRLEMLNELQTDLKTIIVEIVEIEPLKKRLNFFREARSPRAPIQAPKFQTDLMIKEWRIIRQSKVFVKNWLKELAAVFRCWKKRKPEWDLQKITIKLLSKNIEHPSSMRSGT